MKKFSVNLLKIGLLLILGLCMFGMTLEVKAANEKKMLSVNKPLTLLLPIMEETKVLVVKEVNIKNNNNIVARDVKTGTGDVECDYISIKDANKVKATHNYISYYDGTSITFNKIGTYIVEIIRN